MIQYPIFQEVSGKTGYWEREREKEWYLKIYLLPSFVQQPNISIYVHCSSEKKKMVRFSPI